MIRLSEALAGLLVLTLALIVIVVGIARVLW